MIMRFRPANIRLIDRRSNLPRLLLALSSNNGKSNDNDQNNPTVVQRLTGHSISVGVRGAIEADEPGRGGESRCSRGGADEEA
jgi:hypothetical protein